MAGTIVVSTRKGLFTVGRNAEGWAIRAADFLGDNVSLALADRRDGRLYAALDHGHFGVKMHRRNKGGWEEVAAPAYPPKPEGHEENDMWGRPLPWSTVRVWALQPAGRQAGSLWCGTIPGGLFRSDDGGATWQIVGSLWHHPRRREWMGGGADLPGLHHVSVDPRNADRVLVAVSTGGIWSTEDGGQTWQQRGEGMRADHVPPERTHDSIMQDVHAIARCPARPDRIWVQHHNGIFISDDEARTFREITGVEPSVFGFAVVVHPEDPDTAWFVPEIKDEKRIPVEGRVVVTRTRDGGRTFEVLSRGLPQRHAYDVVYRHALAIDDSGQCLAMGSTTGGLWVSENGGDDWQEISHTLPPVYAVSFAA